MKVYDKFVKQSVESEVPPESKYSKGDMVVVKGKESYNKIDHETHTMDPTLLPEDEEGEVVKVAWAEGSHPHYTYWVELNSGGTIITTDEFLCFATKKIAEKSEEEIEAIYYAEGWSDWDIGYDDAYDFISKGFSADEGVKWMEYGFSADDAKYWEEIGVTPEEAYEKENEMEEEEL